MNPVLNENVCGAYVLLCHGKDREDDYIYVGSSTNVPRRLGEHINGYGHGGSKSYCGWTSLHKPKHIFYVWKTQFINNNANQNHVYKKKVSMERVLTLMAFELWGTQKVRGHAYSTVDRDYSKSTNLHEQLTTDKYVTQTMIACDFIIDKGLPESELMDLEMSNYSITEYFDECLQRYKFHQDNDPVIQLYKKAFEPKETNNNVYV